MMDDASAQTGPERPALHFVGFRGDEYGRAVRIFGVPDFIHIGWDRWAREAVAVQDVAVFARGTFADAPAAHGFPDFREARNADDAAAL